LLAGHQPAGLREPPLDGAHARFVVMSAHREAQRPL
jgi:hypothetical protein